VFDSALEKEGKKTQGHLVLKLKGKEKCNYTPCPYQHFHSVKYYTAKHIDIVIINKGKASMAIKNLKKSCLIQKRNQSNAGKSRKSTADGPWKIIERTNNFPGFFYIGKYWNVLG